MYLRNKYRERTISGWSEEKSLGKLFEPFSIMHFTASSNDTYVFDERDTIGTISLLQMKVVSFGIVNEREDMVDMIYILASVKKMVLGVQPLYR